MDVEPRNQFDIKKIKLIVGLGNIGREYDQTRHNVGFEFVETIAGTVKFNNEQKLKAQLYSKELSGNKVLLCKPTTFMNTSGEAVILVSRYYNINPEEILIIHDDLDLRIGNYKTQFAKGPKIHNGITSIENRMGTTKFWRLRIGVDNRDISTRNSIQGQSYVLSRFKPQELEMVSDVIHNIIQDW